MVDFKEIIQQYVGKYTEIGLSSSPTDKVEAEKDIARAYANAIPKSLPPPASIVWVDSPKAGIDLLRKMKADGEIDIDEKEMFSCGFGQYEVSWLAYCDFLAKEIGDKSFKIIEPLIDLARNVGWWWPFDEMCIVSKKHTLVKLNSQRQLHNEHGPAIAWEDGFCFYALNGVYVPKEIVETPAYKLDPELVFKTENVSVRREILRKITMERFLQHVQPNILDSVTINGHPYELLEMPEKRDVLPRMVFLKMINPSIQTYHIEGVHPRCKTVQEAIDWRASTIIDEDESWVPSNIT